MQLLALAVALLAMTVSAKTPGQASNFNLSTAVYEKHGCGTACQANLMKASAEDLKVFDTPFDFDFYDTASNFSSSAPGSLLKLKPLNGTALDIPGGVSVYKIQYTSQDIDGSPVPATGFIAMPFVRRQRDPFKLVAAARKAFPHDLTHKWVSMGHSQGGGAVYKLSEHKLVQDDSSGYLGGVSLAPVVKLYDSMIYNTLSFGDASSEEMEDYKVFGVLGSIAFGLQALFPNYTAPFIAPPMRQRLELAQMAQYCDVALSETVTGLSFDDLIGNITATDVAALQKFQKINSPAQGDKASKPLLLIQREKDTIVFKSLIDDAYKDSCDAGNRVRLSVYPGLDHSAAVGASAPEWLSFIGGLFSSTINMTHCVNSTITPFDQEHAASPPDDV
ncbi:hypothetical protein P170DRAFT_421407 [Aspergillus steynii IBT 23096]|uniref:Alpha/beta-hydrolase n=1 Tax=Aspergillus steynii IBT 23096 TaxID=1392250 RepID=A0A2I2GPG3_9EURO|nr:uncharacterized protein P170DRAFT_421407 [Aspergillus steynii IBT 23096]PLB54753.1 hypothetical protein P170DRAFT_421407 [Aspergillus steynii IBT 23096]